MRLFLHITEPSLRFGQRSGVHDKMAYLMSDIEASTFGSLGHVDCDIRDIVKDKAECIHFSAHIRHAEHSNAMGQTQQTRQRVFAKPPITTQHHRTFHRRRRDAILNRQIIFRQFEMIRNPTEEQQGVAPMPHCGFALLHSRFAQRTEPDLLGRQIFYGWFIGQHREERRSHSQDLSQSISFGRGSTILLIIGYGARGDTKRFSELDLAQSRGFASTADTIRTQSRLHLISVLKWRLQPHRLHHAHRYVPPQQRRSC